MLEFYKKLKKADKFLVMVCFFGFFTNGTLSTIMGSMLPDLKAAYNLSDTVSGLFLSAHSAGNVIAAFISGLVPLLIGQRKSVVCLAALTFIGFAMTIIWGNPLWLLVAFFFIGMGRGSITSFDNKHLNRVSGGSPAATNLLHSAFAIGAIIAPTAFLVLRNAFSWRIGIGYMLVISFVSILLFSRLRFDPDKPSRSDKNNSTLIFMREPSFVIHALMMFCYLCSEYAINGWLVTYVQNNPNLLSSITSSGINLTTYSQAMSALLWAMLLTGRIICAQLSSKIHQRILMFVSSVGIVIFFALMLTSSGIVTFTLMVAGLGVCMAGISPMIYSDAAFYTNRYPMATSMILCIGCIGAIIMPVTVGALADRLGFTGGMSAIFVTVVLLCIFSGLNVFIRPEKSTARLH